MLNNRSLCECLHFPKGNIQYMKEVKSPLLFLLKKCIKAHVRWDWVESRELNCFHLCCIRKKRLLKYCLNIDDNFLKYILRNRCFIADELLFSKVPIEVSNFEKELCVEHLLNVKNNEFID